MRCVAAPYRMRVSGHARQHRPRHPFRKGIRLRHCVPLSACVPLEVPSRDRHPVGAEGEDRVGPQARRPCGDGLPNPGTSRPSSAPRPPPCRCGKKFVDGAIQHTTGRSGPSATARAVSPSKTSPSSWRLVVALMRTLSRCTRWQGCPGPGCGRRRWCRRPSVCDRRSPIATIFAGGGSWADRGRPGDSPTRSSVISRRRRAAS